MENFGTIKDTFNTILAESIIKKNSAGKKIFSNYLQLLKENKILKSQYFIYKNLETKKFSSESNAKFYIKENISLLKDLDKKEITIGNKKLLSLLKNQDINKENSELYEHINILATTKTTPSSLDTLQNQLILLKIIC